MHDPLELDDIDDACAEELAAGELASIGQDWVQRAAILATGTTIQAADLHFEVTMDNELAAPALHSDLRDREHELIVDALRVAGGNRQLAAERLGISPRTLRYKLAQLRAAGIEVPQGRQSSWLTRPLEEPA